MDDLRRRRASPEEIAQGQDEIRRADERFQKEAVERGEQAIEDNPEKKADVEVGVVMAPPLEDRKEDHQRDTPARSSNQGSTKRPLKPPTDPPPEPPALGNGDSSNGMDDPKLKEKLDAEPLTSERPLRSEMATPGGPKTEAATPSGFLGPQMPLFSEEQLRSFAMIHGQAPWLYGNPQSIYAGSVPRPAFLDVDAQRVTQSQMERDVEFLKLQIAKDREEKEEFKRQIQVLSAENQKLKSRVENGEKGSREEEHRFSTPEEQDSKTLSGLREEDTDWLRRRSSEESGGQKEAARPPFLPEAADFKEAADFRTPKEAERPPRTKVEDADESSEKSKFGKSVPKAGETTFTEKSIEFMMIMMETMKDLQKKVSEGKEETGMVRGVEVVRTGIPDLPVLQQWTPSQGPLQLGDWLLTVEPIAADLSATSELWWSLMVKAAEDWYQRHMAMSPLDRVQHDVKPPPTVSLEKWSRLERRMASMLLQAVPEGVKDELISARRLSVFGILTQLLLTYCPGGVLEKQTLLRSLEDPLEVGTMSEAPSAIRRWLRWKLRTEEIGAVTPDPALLLKGLNKLTRKVLEANKELQFRVSLARNSLGVDTRPTDLTVSHFATHLLAEIEQVALSEKRAAAVVPKGEPKLKSMEVDKGKGKGREKFEMAKGEERQKPKCKFFLTDGGCRKGKECGFSHDMRDEKRRCYTCGSVEHLAPSCTRSRGPSTETSPTKPRMAKAEGDEKGQTAVRDPEVSSQASSESAVKDLLEESNKMLRSLAPSSSGQGSSGGTAQEDERKDVMERLQQQLKAMKTFKLRRLTTGAEVGLVDSGATHALRPRKDGENVQSYPLVDVGLADGRAVRLRMAPGGSMISPSPAVEPIVPMGQLTTVLGCQIAWRDGSMQLQHPERGDIPIHMKEGCPHLSKSVAWELIVEMEDAKVGIPKQIGAFDEEVCWMRRLVEQHAVLSKLPEHIKERLVVCPGEWSSIPGNRHQRKRWRRDGMMVHLFAGPDSGFTLKRALRQHGGPDEKLLEVDIKRGPQHDMLADEGVYSGLIRAAFECKILSIVAGPNCRTRSLLRHVPVPGQPDAPRPIRRWGGEEFGIADATEEEIQKLHEDDVMMWRCIFLFMLSTYMRRARQMSDWVAFGLEQPASPKDYMPEGVSFWDTQEWKAISEEFELEEITFKQGTMGGASPKPTTFGGNLELNVGAFQRRNFGGPVKVSSSLDLSRWAPGLMAMVSVALINQVCQSGVKCKAMTWEEHLEFRHIPYRRDCRVCQESSQQCPPHRRVKDPLAGVLSIDTAGPMKPAYDMGGALVRYFLVGALTWRVPRGTDKLKDPPEEETPDDAPLIEADGLEEEPPDEDGSGQRVLVQLSGEAPGDERSHPGGVPDEDGSGGDPLVQLSGDGAEPAEPLQTHGPQTLEEATEMRVFRMALPMKSKKAKEVVATVMEFVLRLRAEGYHVGRIHSDQGHELAGEFKRWALQRGIYLTKTPGDDPSGNGRAEMAVKAFKNYIRRTLRQAFEDAKWWPWALRYVNEVERCIRMDQKPEWPRFLQEVRVRKRTWRKDDLSSRVEKVQYLCPSVENHGHWIYKQGEAPRLTRCILAPTVEPEDEAVWIAVEREGRDAQEQRRRIRGKSTLRKVDASLMDQEEAEEEEKKIELKRVMKLVEEEMQNLINEDPELAADEVRILGRLKKMVEEQGENEEILQTKIISPKEVLRNWEDWEPSIRSEVESLTVEKMALKPLSKSEVEELKLQAQKEGRKLEILPSKMVFTIKPGGKLKSRWVVCGNYEEKKEGEETYSTGADATTLRILVWASSKMGWNGCVLDIRTAFLNADMEQSPEEDLLVIQAPHVLREARFFRGEALFLPLRAVYGFRRSPRLWGLHRDRTMREMKIPVTLEGRKETLIMKQMESEQNLWKVVIKTGALQDDLEEELVSNGRVVGLVMTYVDDILVSGRSEVMKAVTQRLQETWSTSTPEEIGEKPVRFLGVEITCCQAEGEETAHWSLNQQAYTKDLLGRYEDGEKIRKIPITRDQATMSPDVIPPSAEGVKTCQKVIGELLWLVTRTRPDLMFGVSRMGASVLKSTHLIQEAAKQMRLYLKGTVDEGLKFEEKPGDPVNLYVYSDSSFAPESDESHGSFIVMVNGNLMFWRSGRQSAVTLSTAESELTELVEAMVAGESVYAIIAELFSEVSRIALCDSQAALAILMAEGGSWRTRHLRLRWAFARQVVMRGDWQVSHVPGERMIADLGTKALASTRLQTLKEMLGMKKNGCFDEEKVEEAEEKAEKISASVQGSEVATMALRLITMAASLQMSKAQEDDEEETSSEFKWLVMTYTLLVVILTLGFQTLWKVGVSSSCNNLRIWLFGGESRSLPAEDEEPEVQRPKFEELGAAPTESRAEDGSGQRVLVQLAQADPSRAEDGSEQEALVQLAQADQQGRAEDGSEQEALVQLAQAQSSSSGSDQASSSGSGSTSDSMAERIQATIRTIAEEEVQLWREYRSTGHFPPINEDHQGADLGFDVFRTPCGTVYHSTRSCTQLKGPRTGFARKFEWCGLCKEVAMRTRGRPPPGSPLLLLTSGQTLHTDTRCPRTENVSEFRGCMYCTDYIG